MIQHTGDSVRRLAALRSELDWLKDNHPEMVELIAVAEASLRVADQAAGDAKMWREWVDWSKELR